MEKEFIIDKHFYDRFNEINNAEHGESMSQRVAEFDDGCFVYFDAFDDKDGGYCQFVLYDKCGRELSFTEPLYDIEVVDDFEFDKEHILNVHFKDEAGCINKYNHQSYRFYECGSLIFKGEHEFEAYACAYDKKNGYYDILQCFTLRTVKEILEENAEWLKADDRNYLIIKEYPNVEDDFGIEISNKLKKTLMLKGSEAVVTDKILDREFTKIEEGLNDDCPPSCCYDKNEIVYNACNLEGTIKENFLNFD